MCQTLALRHGLIQPRLEVDLAEPCVGGGNERTFSELSAKIPRVWVDDDFAAIVARGEALSDQLIETELFGASHLNRAVQRRAHGDPANRLGDVVGRHGLNEDRWQPNRRSVRGFVGDALDELEELGGMDDRVGDSRALDQSFLSGLRPKIWTVGNALGSDH